jgi:hypothetical protein
MARKRLLMLLIAIAAFALGLVASLRSESPTNGSGFNSELRDLYFAAFNGDAKAMETASKRADGRLAANPKDADALVWHGVGVFFSCGQAFQKGDMETGMDLYRKGLDEMARAVELDPDNDAVRSVRGGILMQATLHMDGNPETGQLIDTALSDYEHVYEARKSTLDKMDTHARGELLFGLADGNRRAGNEAKAREWFKRVSSEMNGTPYQKRADSYLQTGTLSVEESACQGCHAEQH